MSAEVYRISQLLVTALCGVPIGTNLSLYYLCWSLVSGRFLLSRGALFPALSDFGLDKQSVRRVAAAVEYGHFSIERILASLGEAVEQDGGFVPHCYAGICPVACDLVGFFRPKLVGCTGKHYHSAAGKALPAVVFAMVGAVGSVAGKRFALLRRLERAKPQESDRALSERIVSAASAVLTSNEALICDAGFALPWLLSARLPGGFVVRLKNNSTFRRNYLPAYKGRGRRPQYGERVRPLPGKRKDNILPATKADKEVTFMDGRHKIKAFVFEDLVLSDKKPGGQSFQVVLIVDPRYKHPLMLATNLQIGAYFIFRLYKDRWPIEQLPLAAKQIIGAGRCFAFGKESRYRLPELAMLSASVLFYAAATVKTIASGFWDRTPNPTCGRLRRALFGLDFSKLAQLQGKEGQLRKKASVTWHLKKGVAAHRRAKNQAQPAQAAAAA